MFIKNTETNCFQPTFAACIPTLSMGGVTRGLLTLMHAENSTFHWGGIAIGSPSVFDVETARLILKRCPLYSHQDHSSFCNLVTIVDNPVQKVIDQSDFVKLFGYQKTNPILDKSDWSTTTAVIIAHGQCQWTKKTLNAALKIVQKKILGAVSKGSVNCFPKEHQDSVSILYNGIDINRCTPHNKREHVRNQYQIRPEAKIVLYMGRFNSDKNPLVVAKAIRYLPSDFHALYVGEGLKEKELRNAVTAICGERATIIPRIENIGDILGAVDCVVSASPTEGGSQLFSEAWAAGCPLVSTRTGFLPEMEEEFGKVFHELPLSPTGKQAAKIISQAIERDTSLIDRGQAAYKKYFTAEKMRLSYERFFNDSITEHRITKNKSQAKTNLEN